jgi:CRISPR/Cas system-associated endonuclease Cas1
MFEEGDIPVGLIRKAFAVSAAASGVPVVRMNSKKQRVAKAQLDEIKKQTEILRQQTALTQQPSRRLQPSQALLDEAEARRAARTAASHPIAQRLAELDALCKAGTITQAESDARRMEILREV